MNQSSEMQLTENIIRMLKYKLEKEYKPGETKRDAHAKAIGLLKSYFIIEPNLDPRYQVGIFKEPKTYKSFIRISNSTTEDESKKDVRGFSIKLLGVDGRKVSDDEKATQDFVLVSTETMPLGTLKLFHDAIYYTTKSNPVLFGLKLLKNGQLYIIQDLLKARKHHNSVLNISYFSTTPYMFSNKVVKYKIEPRVIDNSKPPNKLSYNYLTIDMQNRLSDKEYIFDFYVQFQTDENSMPINDASIKWSSEFIKLATIKIPPQKFTTTERYNLGEVFSFSPAHSIIPHKPIGDINTSRITIYKEMSKFRHNRNNENLIEPDEELFDKIK